MRAPMPNERAPLRLEYAREPDVSGALDAELRELISSCFDQPHNAFFRERRYAQEMPLHRFMGRSEDGVLAAHLAVHEKRVTVAGVGLTVGGMAEVCVRSTQRGQGHMRRLLERAHQQLVENGIEHALLLGEPALYASSGYLPLHATVRRTDPKTRVVQDGVMADLLHKSLANEPWPAGPIDLCGPIF
jgi:predicted N-acetyltransferase YhbS